MKEGQEKNSQENNKKATSEQAAALKRIDEIDMRLEYLKSRLKEGFQLEKVPTIELDIADLEKEKEDILEKLFPFDRGIIIPSKTERHY